MSKRRKPGDVVARSAGSGFLSASEPRFIRICDDEPEVCLLGCGDPKCQEWANLEVVEGPHKGDFLYHVAECQMEDPPLVPRGDMERCVAQGCMRIFEHEGEHGEGRTCGDCGSTDRDAEERQFFSPWRLPALFLPCKCGRLLCEPCGDVHSNYDCTKPPAEKTP